MHVSYDEQRELYRRLRADQETVRQAAAALRHGAISVAYADLDHKIRVRSRVDPR
jgi:uncharacterized protein YukE